MGVVQSCLEQQNVTTQKKQVGNSSLSQTHDAHHGYHHHTVPPDANISWPELTSSRINSQEFHLSAIKEATERTLDNLSDDDDDQKEKESILEDVRLLRAYAKFHLHPEEPVMTVDPTTYARNFFYRPSASPQDLEGKGTTVSDEERSQVWEDLRLLKAYAHFHLHPEEGVTTTDPCARGRNYFDRPSSHAQTTVEEAEEREHVLEQVGELRKFAHYHLHPEEPVKTEDPLLVHTNYFDRPSAPAQITEEEAEEREHVLGEAEELRKFAHYHLHPEEPVKTEDPMLVHTNYFDRPSAPAQITEEETEEREHVLEEVEELRKFAHYHLHPEEPVKTEDPLLVHTNYFDRPSAPAQITEEEAEEREHVLEEAEELRKVAHYHLHPEEPVEMEDPMLVHTNYFDRSSALPQETRDEAEERHNIMEDLEHLADEAQTRLHSKAIPDFFHSPVSNKVATAGSDISFDSPRCIVMRVNSAPEL